MRFLLSVYRPTGYDHAQHITAEVMAEIDRVNEEMEAAGVRVFVGGLQPPSTVHSVIRGEDGSVRPVSGSAGQEDRFLDGLWVLEVKDEAEAIAWAEKAARACRATIEARPFY